MSTEIIQLPNGRGAPGVAEEWPSGPYWRVWRAIRQLPRNFQRRYGIWRHVPVLMWRGQQCDVRITFTDFGLGGDLSAVHRAEEAIRALGITYDGGTGFHGRDLEFDWSLSGPILVTFTEKNRTPERRRPSPYRDDGPGIPIDLPPVA